MTDNDSTAQILDRLYATIKKRRNTDPNESYVARLYAGGTATIAKKLGEEAVETVLAAQSGDRQQIVSESADLIFHWLVLLASSGVTPQAVFEELMRREGISGLDEKKSRQ